MTHNDTPTQGGQSLHTKGPWEIDNREESDFVFVNNEWGGEIAKLSKDAYYCLGDARLIAAAPDLLSACQRVREQLLEQGFVNAYEGAMLEAAIAKAEGKD